MQKIRLLPGIMTLGFIVLAIPVIGAIAVAIWLAGAAALENVKFARCTEQILTIVARAQDDASKDASFGATQGENIVDDLMRRGQLQDVPLNAWGGGIRAAVPMLPLVSIETDLPSYACKRLALYLGKNAAYIKLQKMEAREESGNWSTFFDAAIDPDTSALPGVNAACGKDWFLQARPCVTGRGRKKRGWQG